MKFPVIFRVMGGLTLLPALASLFITTYILFNGNYITFGKAMACTVIIGISMCFITASFVWLLAFRNSYFFLHLCAGLAVLLGASSIMLYFLDGKTDDAKAIGMIAIFTAINILYAVFLFLISISAGVKQWVEQLPEPKKEKFSLVWLLVFIGIAGIGPAVVFGMRTFVKTEAEVWPGEITVTYRSGIQSVRTLNDHDVETGYSVSVPSVREQADGISFKLHFDEPKIVDKIRIVNSQAHLEEAYIVVDNKDLKKIIFTIHGDTSVATLGGISLTDLEIKPTRLNDILAGTTDVNFKEIQILSKVPYFSKSPEYNGYNGSEPNTGDSTVVTEEFYGDEYIEGEGDGYGDVDEDRPVSFMAYDKYDSKQTLTKDKLPDFFKPGFNQWLDWKNYLMVVEQEPIIINDNNVGTYYGGTGGLTWMILPPCFKRFNGDADNADISDVQTIEKFTGIKPYISRSEDGKDFNYVNPEIVIWASENLIPDPSTVFYDYAAGDVYHKTSRRFFRLMAESHQYIIKSEGFEFDKKEYKENIAKGDFAAVDFFRKKYSDVLTNYAPGEDNYSKMGPPEAISFWLRRSIDGTEDELYSAVVKVLKTYDREWYEKTIQK